MLKKIPAKIKEQFYSRDSEIKKAGGA
jgi:hypothetical protein